MVLAEAQDLLKNPTKLRTLPKKRNMKRYCRYHKDYGYNTDECSKLKMAIEKLIKKGHLVEFIANDPQP